MKVLIIGKNGQVAWELQQTCPSHIHAKAFGRENIDITNPNSIEAVISTFQPAVIINAAAYTAVDKAESDKDNAYLINATAVEYLAKAAHKHSIRFIHISTDFVFDGSKNKPYTVSDKANPINVYGASKLAGEQAIAKYCPENSAIVRTSWVYSSHGNNFVKTMLRLMAEKDELNVVSDQIGCPTNARGLARFLWQLAVLESLEPIYHYSDLGVASWYDFAVAIQEIAYDAGKLEKKIPIKPIPASNYPTPAKRPVFSLMLKGDNGVHWREYLSSMLS
ncbi:dTDP-4-dehydrorhamnose reductase [Pseudoalteromonas lipolytica]|uniref:dTDP-4-dehydrorhamnose reductase n=1 Tax=Pseudoalteromonas lipolytica TaxID=570156 RepID=A0ABY1GRF6_9GAMM|nr:dTDP-4-dehydrorhamnose reductase [Pseudoalteromonas lipolytica]MBE0349638.1 dTDP-4-dehydrorhamnose reductase [Pseudoalteromonas lipolytica LMEB 39]SFT78403.1 dTDP-4-dehydrorhamnose reductase [Pseudoalteromonas lipolytica]